MSFFLKREVQMICAEVVVSVRLPRAGIEILCGPLHLKGQPVRGKQHHAVGHRDESHIMNFSSRPRVKKANHSTRGRRWRQDVYIKHRHILTVKACLMRSKVRSSP